MHRRIRKEFAIFARKLCRECLVVCDNERRPLYTLDDVRHSEGFARTRDAKERLVALSLLESLYERLNSRRLVPPVDTRFLI